jgi:hypothetical protein
VRKVNFTAICEIIVQNMWDPRRLTTLQASIACYRESFTLFLTFTVSEISAVYLISSFLSKPKAWNMEFSCNNDIFGSA